MRRLLSLEAKEIKRSDEEKKMTEELGKVRGGLEKVTADVEGLSNGFDVVRSEVSGVEEGLKSLSVDVGELREGLGDVTKDVDGLDGRMVNDTSSKGRIPRHNIFL